jgi:hypothetical protein
MKPFVLTGFLISDFLKTDLADIAIVPYFKFIWGELPPPDELAAYLGPRTDDGPSQGYHWSDFASYWGKSGNRIHRNLSLAEFCLRYESVELWFDTQPQAQLQLCWLLDYFRSYPEAISRLKLRLVDQEMIGLPPGASGKWRPPLVDVTEREITTGSTAWQAYCAPTPGACFALLGTDLSALALLGPVLHQLLDELPSATTGLGATEMRMLELVGRGYSRTNALFHLRSLRQTRVFDEWQHGFLLDGLSFGPKPVISGLDEALRTLSREEYNKRLDAYHRSRLTITDFGKAVLAHEEDFSRHNPIDRWWGGTHLTNDNMWRYDPILIPPVRH